MQNQRRLWVVSACALLFAASAHAGDFDMVGNTVNGVFLGANEMSDGGFFPIQPDGLQTWRIYVSGVPDSWALTRIFGDQQSPMSIATEDGSNFFNAPDFGQAHFEPDPAIIPTNPSLQWDTWVSLGGAPGIAVSPGFPNIALEDGGDNIVNNDSAAWFDSDPDTPVTGETYIIGQWTFNAEINATFHLSAAFTDLANQGEMQIRDLVITVPAPGALALFGVFGFTGFGRRRARLNRDS